MIEDKAITGRTVSRFSNKSAGENDLEKVIDQEFTAFMFELLGMKLELRNRLYDGAEFPETFLYEMKFNERYTVTFIIQYEVIKHMVSMIVGVPINEVTPNVIITFVQADFDEHFAQGVPVCSMLWSSSKGLLAVCIDDGEKEYDLAKTMFAEL